MHIWFQNLKESLNILNLLMGKDRNFVYKARSEMRKSGKNRKDEKKEATKIGEEIYLLEAEKVQKEFFKLCKSFDDEFGHYKHVAFRVILLLNSEFNRLKRLYEAETKPEDESFRKEVRDVIIAMKNTASNWMTNAARVNDLTIHLSDMDSLCQELSHILDPFNAGRLARKISKEERRVINEDNARRKASIANIKRRERLSKKEAAALKRLENDLSREVSLEDKAEHDDIKIMQLELMQFNDLMDGPDGLITRLRKTKYPGWDHNDSYFGAITARKNKSVKTIKDDFEAVSNNARGLWRIMESVRT